MIDTRHLSAIIFITLNPSQNHTVMPESNNILSDHPVVTGLVLAAIITFVCSVAFLPEMFTEHVLNDFTIGDHALTVGKRNTTAILAHIGVFTATFILTYAYFKNL